MLAAQFGTGQVFWSILWFFLFFMWIMLLFQVTVDIFRSHDLSGGVKALWILFVIVFPYLGVLVYLIARGGKMHEHQVQAIQQDREAVDQYIRQGSRTASAADELTRLADLRSKGVIDDAEFATLKAKILNS